MRHALVAALVSAGALAVPQEAEASWPKTLDIEICWNFVCDGTFATWTMRRNGEFVDQYGAGGDYFWEGNYPVWPYTTSWVLSPSYVGLVPGPDPDCTFLLFYDNGLTSYSGTVANGRVIGTMVTTAFYPPYVIYGQFCQDGCP